LPALCTDIEERIIQVLTDFMATELSIVDSAKGGAATPPITLFLKGPRPLESILPCINVEVKEYFQQHIIPADLASGRMEYKAGAEVNAHVGNTSGSTEDMLELAKRYLAAMARVLLAKK